MERKGYQEQRVVDHAQYILTDMGLTWNDLKGKRVLDAGSGSSSLAHAASLLNVDTQIISTDINRNKKWQDLPQDAKNNVIQADTENLPFADESFDLVIDHVSLGIFGLNEATRVLKTGGQYRMYPLGDQLLEYWYIFSYLDEIKHEDPHTIQALLEKFDQEIAKSEGGLPDEYSQLLEEALTNLSPQQKVRTIEGLVHRYEEQIERPLDFQLKDPNAHKPNGVLIFQK